MESPSSVFRMTPDIQNKFCVTVTELSRAVTSHCGSRECTRCPMKKVFFIQVINKLSRYAKTPKSTDIDSLSQVCLQLSLLMKLTHSNMFAYCGFKLTYHLSLKGAFFWDNIYTAVSSSSFDLRIWHKITMTEEFKLQITFQT